MGKVGTPEIVAEFVGTFLLVFTVGCNVLGKTPVWAGVSIACVLMVSIYALGGISGANFNPAVSFSLGLSQHMGGNGMPWKDVAIYMGVQVFAGLVAAFSYAILFWNAFNLGPTKGFGAMSAGACEFFYTFMLCFVVLNVAAARKYQGEGNGNQWYGLAIGFVIIAGAYGAGVVSGGCFNPAVAIGIDTSSAGLGFGWCVIYTLNELSGAAVAVLAFKVVRPGDFERSSTPFNPDRKATLTSRLTSEFLGTFMLVLTVGLNILGNSPAGAFSIAASLMCMIYALGDVSGAHFNPAVTCAIVIYQGASEDLSNKIASFYILAQVAGGLAASVAYSLIYHGKTFALGPLPGYHSGQVAVAEIIFTFVLCYVVIATAVSPKTSSKSMFGLAIGSCVTVGGFAIGSVSGGSLNPAVSVAIAVSHLSKAGHASDNLSHMLSYCCFEFIGAGLAATVAKVTHAKTAGK